MHRPGSRDELDGKASCVTQARTSRAVYHTRSHAVLAAQYTQSTPHFPAELCGSRQTQRMLLPSRCTTLAREKVEIQQAQFPWDAFHLYRIVKWEILS